jgi:hypothetical protein
LILPHEAGLGYSLARPCGNVTDVRMMLVELMLKRLELVLAAKVMALLVNPKNANAQALGLTLSPSILARADEVIE